MGTGGVREPARKHVTVSTGSAASVVATLAEALGYRVSRGFGGDLHVVETTHADEVPRGPEGPPVLVLAPRRLRAGEIHRLKGTGAVRVLDAGTCILTIAYALTDLLFDGRTAQRHYGERHGRLDVEFEDEAGEIQRGRLTGVAQVGGYVVAERAPPEGASVTLRASLGPWALPILGRVAFVDGALRPGFGVEFALDDHCVAPRLEGLLEDTPAPRPASGRRSSGVLV